MQDQPVLSAQVIFDFHQGKDRVRNFELIFRAYGGTVTGYFARQGVDRDQARDLAQEVFLVVFENMGSLKDPASFRSWLFGICHNKFLRYLERAKYSGVTANLENLTEQVADPAMGALDSALVVERRNMLREALEDLPQQMRACVKLSVVEELEYSEIARRLGLSANTVKVHLHRARKSLAASLGWAFGKGASADE